MAFATSLIGGARRAATARRAARGLSPEEQAMLDAMQSDIQPAMTRPEPRPAPMPQQPRPLIGGSMPQAKPQSAKPPSMWDGIKQDPLAFLLRGSDGVAERQAAEAKQAQYEAEQQRMEQEANTLRQQGYGEDQVIAFMNNAPEWSKNLSTMVGANAPRPSAMNLGGGAVAQFDPLARDGERLSMLREASPPPEKPPWIGATKGPDGQWGWDQNYIKGYRQMYPGSAGGGGNAPPSGYRWKQDGSLERIPGGPADKPPGPEYDAPTMRKFMSQAQTLDALEGSINQYMDLIKQYGPQVMTTGIGGDNPIAKKLDAANTNIKMQAKALFDLGVINGPDLQILNSAIPPVTGLDAWGKSKESVDGQLQMLRDYIARGRDQIPEQFVSRARPNGGPQGPTKPSREQMASNSYLQGFSPEMRSAMIDKFSGSPDQQASDPEDAFINSLFPEDSGDAPPEGSGITPEEWALMPPEDKALFQ